MSVEPIQLGFGDSEATEAPAGDESVIPRSESSKPIQLAVFCDYDGTFSVQDVGATLAQRHANPLKECKRLLMEHHGSCPEPGETIATDPSTAAGIERRVQSVYLWKPAKRSAHAATRV